MAEPGRKRISVPPPSRTVANKPLPQQKSDFTAEGSPPPGRVGGEGSATTPPAPDPSDAQRVVPKT